MAGSSANRPGRGNANRGKTGSSAAKASAAKKVPAKGANPAKGTQAKAQPEESGSASKKLFDLRWLIAGMFVVYGIVLVITGIFDNAAEVAKAAGVRINLWTGIGMFVVGLVFAVWARWRPLRPE